MRWNHVDDKIAFLQLMGDHFTNDLKGDLNVATLNV